MGKNLKRIVKLVLLVTCCVLIVITIAASNSYGNVRLLEKYNFEEGGYAVIGKIWAGCGHPIQKSLGNFYTDDVNLLNELKKTWVTGNPAPAYLCGYHYTIYVVKNGESLWSFRVNLDERCNTAVFDGESNFFDPEKLARYKGRFKKLDVKDHRFETLQAARQFLKELTPDPKLLIYWEPLWVKYDGAFKFWLPCNNPNHHRSKAIECLEAVRRQISEKYPNRKFELDSWGGSSNNPFAVEVRCEKELYSEFDLYPKYLEWEPYPLNLKMYYKSSAN